MYANRNRTQGPVSASPAKPGPHPKIPMNSPQDLETVSYPVEFLAGREAGRKQDDLAVEAPLEVRFHGRPITVLMRTPGHDEDLIRGFLFSEGIIRQAEELASLVRPEGLAGDDFGNVIDVHFQAGHRHPGLGRFFYRSASCGACGKNSIASLELKAAPLASNLEVQSAVLGRLPDLLRSAQPTFARSGGVHASGLFTPDGQLVAVREDVGRHNALDKLIGWALAENLVPLQQYLLLVSGRVSYELVQKAVVASIPILAAVGAPSSLAVELASQFQLTLVGFLRPSTMNLYAHSWRVRA